jgi:hypothetical protein
MIVIFTFIYVSKTTGCRKLRYEQQEGARTASRSFVFYQLCCLLNVSASVKAKIRQLKVHETRLFEYSRLE